MNQTPSAPAGDAEKRPHPNQVKSKFKPGRYYYKNKVETGAVGEINITPTGTNYIRKANGALVRFPPKKKRGAK
jgi:hypothetical protein